jgi:hypothetical protein
VDRFGYAQVEALALLAPYLEPRRRRELVLGAFRAMPTVYISHPGAGYEWGDLPPEAHFTFAMMRFAPFVDAGLVDAALGAIPSAWPAESRAYAAVALAGELSAPLRREHARDFLALIPKSRDDAAACRARLALAVELPPDEVRVALDCVLAGAPLSRAALIASAFRALPSSSLATYATRIPREIAAVADPDSRVSEAAAVLDTLEGTASH